MKANLKSPEQVKAEFSRQGLSAAEWAEQNKVAKHLVYRVLAGQSKSLRGQSHRIAVMLGIKDGVIA